MVRAGHGGANRAYLGLCLTAIRAPPTEEVAFVRKSDSRVEDPLVLDEIELYGELVIAASASDRPLSRDEIDLVLGLREPQSGTSAS
jgi:hypothetical protein